jgi:hypothetical protein
MKLLTKIAVLVGILAACAINVRAQRSVDVFEATRTFSLCAPTNIIGGPAGNLTNNWVDIRGLEGLAKIDFSCTTNIGTAGGTLTATVQVSADQTNITTITNFAAITNGNPFIITNNTLGLKATNVVLIPGSATTPMASAVGFATGYLAPLGGGTVTYTNGGAVTITAGTDPQIGFSIPDQPEYARVIWTVGGTATNWTVGAKLTTAVRRY